VQNREQVIQHPLVGKFVRIIDHDDEELVHGAEAVHEGRPELTLPRVVGWRHPELGD
jgi:hypothetical protein